MNKLRVEVDLSNHNTSCEHTMNNIICQQLVADKERLIERLSRVSNQFCTRAVVDVNSLTLNLTNLQVNQGTVHAAFDFDAYHDFEDIDKRQQVNEYWHFQVAQNKAVFELDMPELHPTHEL